MIDDATILEKAHRMATKYKHTNDEPYRFNPRHIVDFARAIEQLARQEQREEDAIDYKLLGCNLTEIFAQLLHQFENNITPITAKDVTASVEGGFARYRSEAVFHAKIDALVYRTIDAIRASGKENSK